jgi:hypothetical protein
MMRVASAAPPDNMMVPPLLMKLPETSKVPTPEPTPTVSFAPDDTVRVAASPAPEITGLLPLEVMTTGMVTVGGPGGLQLPDESHWLLTAPVHVSGVGGSVTSVPPAPSEVALKFAVVYWPSRVSVSTAAPLLTVSVPLALAPEVS